MDGIAADPATYSDGDGRSPLLQLGGYTGRLERLLTLARAQQIDLASLSLLQLVEQLTAALQQAGGRMPLGLQGDWVVMAAWLVLLRSRLLLPADPVTREAAEADGAQLRQELVKLGEVQAAARWLQAQPQLGHDVFARAQPEILGASFADEAELDVVEFLWAAMALFDDDLPQADTAAPYRPRWLDLYSIPEARLRIVRLLTEAPDGQPLDQLLPERAGEGVIETETVLKRRSAWTSTFVASLELAKQGDIVLDQETLFSPIQVSRPPAAFPA